MDVERTTSIVLDDESLRKQHRLVIINLEMISGIWKYLNFTCTSDQNATIRSRLHIHSLDVVSKRCSQTLSIKIHKTTHSDLSHNVLHSKEFLSLTGQHRTILLQFIQTRTFYVDVLQLSSICIIALVEEVDEGTSNFLSHGSKCGVFVVFR